MTKEELKKEAEELYKDWYAHKLGAISIIDVICKMAEPREKQNRELTDKVNDLEDKLANADYQLEGRDNEIRELKAQIEEMKKELHHRLVSPSHDDSDCLDKIVMLDRLWQFGQEF